MANYRIGTTLSPTCASLASNLDKNRNSRPGTPVSRFSNQTCNPNAKERKRKILSNHHKIFFDSEIEEISLYSRSNQTRSNTRRIDSCVRLLVPIYAYVDIIYVRKCARSATPCENVSQWSRKWDTVCVS